MHSHLLPLPFEAPVAARDWGRIAFGCAIAYVVAAYSMAVARPIEPLLANVADDAFYYLEIARNIATTGNSTFDGINPTNGYHPGWMAILTLTAAVFQDSIVLLRAALMVSLALHVASAVLLARGLSRWLPAPWASIGGACWVLNPLPVELAHQACESSLYACALAGAFCVYSLHVAPRLAEGDVQPRQLSLLALSLAGCFYGRTESIILSGIVIAAVAFASAADWRRRFEAALLMGGIFAATIAPWFLFSYFAIGTVSQGSGTMKMLWAAEAFDSLKERLLHAQHYLTYNWLSPPFGPVPGDMPRLLRNLVRVELLALFGVLLYFTRVARARRAATTALVLMASLLVTGGVYGVLFKDTQAWYRVQPGMVLFLIYFVLFSQLLMWLGRARPELTRAAALLAPASLAVVVGLHLKNLNLYPWQSDVYTSQPRFEARVPPDEPIGIFNAGIPAFFSDRTIINLDGLVNGAVIPHYRAGTFDDYLEEAGIHYVIDETVSLERGLRFADDQPQLEELDSAPLRQWSSETRFLWRVSPAE